MKKITCRNILYVLYWIIMIAILALVFASWLEIAIKNTSPNPSYSWWNLFYIIFG